MKNIMIMSWFTVREAMARKVFIFFFAISALVLIGMALVFGSANTTTIIQSFNSSGSDMMMSNVVKSLELLIVTPLAGLGLLLAIFSSSSFIPVMLEKGNIDLLLSKPVSRIQLLLGKYFGGILVVLFNIAFLILGVWLIISLKFSSWDASFLWTILTITFTFAVLYALIVLFGILTRSSIFGMMIAYFIYLILSPLLSGAINNMDLFIKSKFLKGIITGLYYILPKTSELMGSITFGLADGRGFVDFQPIWTSFLFLVAMLGLSISLFMKKDF